jgi:hypothetical protein
MRIELVGNHYIIRATPDEMLEHITALTANVRNAIQSGIASSSRPIVGIMEDGQNVPRCLTTVIEAK